MNKAFTLICILVCILTQAQVKKFDQNISNGEAFGMAISPDGNDLLFVNAYGGRDTLKIFQSSKEGDRWNDPKLAFFSIEGVNQIDPVFSPDGQFIIINMIEEGNGYDVFVLKKEENGWSEIQALSSAINSEAHEFYASMSKNKNLYFTRRNESNDIYVSRWDGVKYLEAAPLSINTDQSESNPYISPKEDFLIFTSDTEDSRGVDLFISFQKKGLWSKPQNLGAPINTELNEFCPSLDLKNKRFLFSRTEVREDKRVENMFAIPLKDLRLKTLRKQAVYPK